MSSTAHIDKLPFEKLTRTLDNVLPNATEVQMDLILANQHALERRMDKIEILMLQLIRALQKRDTNGNL